MSELNMAHPDLMQLAAYHSGQLRGAEAAALAAHLDSCPACRLAMAAQDAETLAPIFKPPEPTLVSLPAGPARAEPLAAPIKVNVPTPLEGHARYRILELLGSGGMGAVYKAEHRLMERTVALKVIGAGLIGSPGALERFHQEVKAAARLSHPNIVTAFDAEQAGDVHFLVMEYVEGMSLAQVVEKHGRLPVLHACEYIRQAALGLQHAFEKGMVHRDIKPHNLMLSPCGRVKILDFGLARFVSEIGKTSNLTATGVFMGTPDFIAPEQAADARAADIRADIYSLGCTLYDLLAGQPPFAEGSAIQKVMAHMDETPKPLSAFRSDVPDELNRVLDKMMAKEPAQRFQTPLEVARALIPLCRATGATSNTEQIPADSSRPEAARPWQAAKMANNLQAAKRDEEHSHSFLRRHPLAVLSVAAAALIALALGSLAGYRATTNKGRLIVQKNDADVELVIRQDGRQIALVGGPGRQEIELKPGAYDIELSGGAKDLHLSKDQISLSRGGDEYVEVLRDVAVARKPAAPEPDVAGPAKPSAPTSSPPLAAAAPGLIRAFEHPDEVWSVAFAPDGRRFLSGGRDKVLHLWDAETGKELARLEGHSGPVEAVAFSPDGRRALSGGGAPDNSLRLWNVETRKELHCMRGHGGVVSVAFSPDGHRALSCGAWPDLSVRLWDLRSGKQLRLLEGHKRNVSAAAFLPNGQRLVSGSWDFSIRLWDVDSGVELRRFMQPTAAIRTLALSPDGQRLLTGNGDKTIRLWDLVQRKEVQCLNGHTERLTAVAFAPDGVRAISASFDKTVRLWDVDSGRELAHFEGHMQSVRAVAFSSDGRRALSASQDKTVRLWRLPEPGYAQKPAPAPGSPDGMGQLAIETHDPGILVNVKQRRKTVASRSADRLMDLRPGNYDVELVEPNEYVRLSRKSITIPWGGQQIVSIGPAQLAWPLQTLRAGRILAPDLRKAKLLLEDDFHNANKNGLLRQSFPASQFGYDKGRYFIRLMEGNDFGSANVRGGRHNDFAYLAMGRTVEPATAGWGFNIFSREQKRGIAVRLNADATLEVTPSPGESEKFRGPQLGPLRHAALKSGADFNALLVIVHGRLVEIYVNGVAVCDPVIVDRDFTPATAGLAAFGRGHGARVEFKSVTGWLAEGLPLPQARGATYK
jgi:serine/threonine protein kinase